MSPLMGGRKLSEDKQDLYRQWVQHIRDHGVNLTETEDEFLTSVEDQMEQGRALSEAQGEWIEDIYTKRTP